MVKKVVETPKNFIKEVKGKVLTSIAAAFAFVIALSWNDAIKSGVDSLITSMGLTGTSYLLKVLAALIVTAIAVAGIWIVSKAQQ
ncbi:MAG: DUF5654 family protein [Candidatus Pacearchaeota archaeon]